jgi:two-component system LytT family sensor kinase
MHNAAFFIKYKLNHVFFWLFIFGLWFMLRYEDYTTPAVAFKVTFLKLVDLIVMVYITNSLLIPSFLYKKRYGLFVLFFLLMILISSVTKMYIISLLTHDPTLFTFSGNIKGRIYDNVIPHFFLVISGASFKLMFDQITLQKKMAELAKDKAEAELNFLKSQINPHFLFNSLNSVYFLIDKNNPDARQALHKFSDMLRYQLYEANGEKIPIEKEIGYLQDYVHLQQLRKDENYKVQFNCSQEVKNFSIEPLLLIPFVENAFKHISHKSRGDNFVKMDMTRSNGYFEFVVENSCEKEIYSTEQHGGIGMNNVKRRLELLYPDAHQLKIDDKENVFMINLKLKI